MVAGLRRTGDLPPRPLVVVDGLVVVTVHGRTEQSWLMWNRDVWRRRTSGNGVPGSGLDL